MKLHLLILTALMAFIPAYGFGADAGGLRIVASIKPIHALVSGVMVGVGKPVLLLKGASSPHAYALRPSEMKAIEEADLVFWGGEALEGFLVKPLRRIGEGRSISLWQADGVEFLPAREGGDWGTHSHGESDGHRNGTAGSSDPHIWLDPRNAAAMVRTITKALAKADPANRSLYDKNEALVLGRLAALEAELAERLAPLAGRPFIVYHDAYQYFEKRFGMTAVGAVIVSPERAVGAKRLAILREKIAGMGPVCIFVEPQFTPKLAESLAEGGRARIGVLDPLGNAVGAGPDLYFDVVRGIGDALAECLGSGG